MWGRTQLRVCLRDAKQKIRPRSSAAVQVVQMLGGFRIRS